MNGALLRVMLRVPAVMLAVIAGILAVFADVAEARPGGGHSYSGGGGGGYSGGGGGGGDGGGALVYFLIRLIIVYPQVGVPLTVVVIVGYVIAKRNNTSMGDWDSTEAVMERAYKLPPAANLGEIRNVDPEFSEVLFSDFAYALYAQALFAKSTPQAMAALAPYLSPGARDALTNRQPAGEAVTGVIIGSMQVTSVKLPSDQGGATMVGLRFESNMMVANQSFFLNERWNLRRDAGAHSRPPSKTKDFTCPNCAAPFQSTDDATCSYCGEVVSAGRFDWYVDSITLITQEKRPPSLTGHAEEEGTQAQTIHAPQFEARLAELQARDASVTTDSIYQRLLAIFHELNRGWSSLELSAARPFISDGMYAYMSYWLGAYQQAGLRNITENTKVVGWDIAKVTHDKYFDSLVVRVWAIGLDYTVDQNGKVVGGSKKQERAYSEYWWLVRGSEVQGAVHDHKQCPHCGAQLQINMGGNCDFCGTHVTSGEFDWVLSKIEQDEAYRG